MAKFFIGLVAGILLTILAALAVLLLVVHYAGKPPVVASNSVLVMRLTGDVPEKPGVDMPAFLGDDAAPTITNIWMALRKAAVDSHIRGIVLEPENLTIGWARLEELRADIEKFRKSGKPVFAYLRNPTAREYYVALAADRIYIGPSETLMLKGMRAELMYFQKTLDKIGVSVEVEHAGKYKDFGDMFTRSDMSPETREVINSLVDGLFGNLVDRIAAARHKSSDEVRGIIDRGPYTAKQALAAGLVDQLSFDDQLWSDVKDKLNVQPKRMPLADYVKVPPQNVGLGGKSKVAIVVGEGDIVRGSPSNDGSGEAALTSYGFDKVLRDVAGDSSIKAVVVRIDSPGGEVTASDEMWREMNLLSKKKPLVISMSDVAASGGYYMAMTGDPIVAYPETETGSIGVVFGKPDLRGLYDKLGISKDGVDRGKHADIDSDYTPLSPEERDLLKNGIDESYRDFLEKVAAARHRKVDDIEPVAQGRVWLGSQAKNNGLVDQLGGIDTAIAMVKQKAGIPASENVSILLYPAKESYLDVLLQQRSSDSVLEAKLRQVAGGMPFHAWMQGGYLRIMPVWVDVK
ncbi:MAG TPA: signal peptide peptidase SppA [Verrucomicrobiae bacterium]|nr:signal peptide peptidase SppA [Verrucomicrobiae bacterium]